MAKGRERERRNLETIRATVIKGSDAVRGGVCGLKGGQNPNSLQTGFIEPKKKHISTSQQSKFGYWDVIEAGILAFQPTATNP